MKKKSGIFFLCIFSMMLCLSGCSQVTPLTDQEQGMIAEYIAHLMLKYDRGYESTLAESVEVEEDPGLIEEEFDVLDEEVTKPSEPEVSEPSEQIPTEPEEPKEPDETVADAELSEIYANPAVRISYQGYEEHAEYPAGEESYFSLVAPEGKKLVVVKFRVRNVTEEEILFSQLESEIKYRLDLDAETIVKPSMTLLMNDLQYMDVQIKAGEEQEAVVVFSVDQEATVEEANLLVYTETKTAIEKMK